MPAQSTIIEMQWLLLRVEDGHVRVDDGLLHVNHPTVVLVRIDVDFRVTDRDNQVTGNWVSNPYQVRDTANNGTILHFKILDEALKMVRELETFFITDLVDRTKVLLRPLVLPSIRIF